jgi:hypothetical protein
VFNSVYTSADQYAGFRDIRSEIGLIPHQVQCGSKIMSLDGGRNDSKRAPSCTQMANQRLGGLHAPLNACTRIGPPGRHSLTTLI